MEIDYRHRLAWKNALDPVDIMAYIRGSITNCQCPRCFTETIQIDENLEVVDAENPPEPDRETECTTKPFLESQLTENELSYQFVKTEDMAEVKLFGGYYVDLDVHVLIEEHVNNYSLFIGNRLYGQPFERQLPWFDFTYKVYAMSQGENNTLLYHDYLYGKLTPDIARPVLQYNEEYEEWEAGSFEPIV